MQKNKPAIPQGIDSVPLLSDSWSRSRRYGLARTADDFPCLAQGELADLIAAHAQLEHVARPVASGLARKMANKQAVVVLSDASGWILHTFGNLHSLQKAQRASLAPGNLWSECGRGTNAIGTALAIADGCEIEGGQHFLTDNRHLYCAAVPLLAPDGRVAGVLDISGPAHFCHRTTLAQVQAAARHIEYLWVTQTRRPQQWLMSLHARPDRLDDTESGLLVFSGDRLTAANSQGLRMLALDSSQINAITFGQLFPQLPLAASSVPMPLHTGGWYRLHAPVQHRPASASAPRGLPFPFSAPGEDAKMVRLLNAGVALCIHGETGCGKEFVSQALHQHSRWREGKFVAINCAAIPESLIESELFGYRPGAFTGASKSGYIGKIREADGGVLFLDEIGDMPLALQTRLLRVLQEKEVAPLGDSRRWPVNFALVCATHRNLAQRVADGEFREDLLYRLQEFSLTIPPLRAWPDLPDFIRQQWLALGGEDRGIALSPPLVDALAAHPWPGNVRQLRSVLKVLLALADDGGTLTPQALPAEYQTGEPEEKRQKRDELLIAATLARFNGNISKAAQALGVARSTLYRRGARASGGR